MDNPTKKGITNKMVLVLDSLYHVLEGTPQIDGERHGNKSSFNQGDIVELIFGKEEIRLRTQGKIYDPLLSTSEEYTAPTTAEQIRSIIQERKEEPSFIRYTQRNMAYNPKKSQIEFCQDVSIELPFSDKEIQKKLKTRK